MDAFIKAGVVSDAIDGVPPAQLKNCSILSSDISLETSCKEVSNDMSYDRIRQERNEIFQTEKNHVSYDGVQLSPGGILTPTQVKNKPKITYDADPSTFYSIICNDLDVPSRADTSMGEFHHWLVINIPGNDVSKGNEVTQYIGSGAPKGTGLHRYVFLLYKQLQGQIDASKLPTIPNNTPKGRGNHKIREFARKFGLELVAGNFYQAEWDEYAPIIHKQLGLNFPDKK